LPMQEPGSLGGIFMQKGNDVRFFLNKERQGVDGETRGHARGVKTEDLCLIVGR
jgi:hypothetical protein